MMRIRSTLSISPVRNTPVGRLGIVVLLVVGTIGAQRWAACAAAGDPAKPTRLPVESHANDSDLALYRLETTRRAVADLAADFANEYPKAEHYLRRLDQIEKVLREGSVKAVEELAQLQREALLDNPLVRNLSEILVVKRRSLVESAPSLGLRSHGGNAGLEYGFPSNHECNSSLPKMGYDNELCAFNPNDSLAPWRTVFRPVDRGYVGEADVHWNADRVLFTQSDAKHWFVAEIGIDGKDYRRVTQMPDDVDAYDACYLPNGKIVFGSSAPMQAVPCWHGQKVVSNLFTADADGRNARRLCYDQDHNFHPSVTPDGQVLYHRWDYTGINHIFMRQLMVMNPDGTGQRAIYGSNSWFPNALYFPRPLPTARGRFVAVLSGYHGPHRMGQLVVLDVNRGTREHTGIVCRISGRGDPIAPRIRDNLVADDWPKFLHPFPLSDKHFLVAAQLRRGGRWGIYLADVFDNLVLVAERPDFGLFEPVPVLRQSVPPVIPERIDLTTSEATTFIQDIYQGPGLAGVPRGTIKSVRVVAYHFGYPGLAGPDVVGWGGPWEVMRILGTAPVREDGSAAFRIPACTPIAIQALDEHGKAVQLMRSWYTAMPGEQVGCVGCHEDLRESPRQSALAAFDRPPDTLRPWYGPARGFSFAREVQPVLDRHCVSCHDGSQPGLCDLRGAEARPDYRGRPLSALAVQRLHPSLKPCEGFVRYTPSYEVLAPLVRRVGIEDDVSLLVPGEYYADTSPLIQLLAKGHGGVRLDREAWERLFTWIDLNAPCHGTWHEAFPIPENIHKRRMELLRLFGGPADDPEQIPPTPGYSIASSVNRMSAPTAPPKPVSPSGTVHLISKQQQASSPPEAWFGAIACSATTQPDDWPWPPGIAETRQEALGITRREIELAAGTKMVFVRIPAGQFMMGDASGLPDEQPRPVRIEHPFWIAATEVTNRQYHCFHSAHRSGYYAKRHIEPDDQGLPLDSPEQPAVRVSFDDARTFCRWLSEKADVQCRLPTEEEWEYACRAGSGSAMAFGDINADFTRWANLADRSFGPGEKPLITGGLEHLLIDGALSAVREFNDGFVVTAPTASFRANPWGLYDMHGNVAEWTETDAPLAAMTESPNPATSPSFPGKVVRGGSFYDPPVRARCSYRLVYPRWLRAINVGFRPILIDRLPQPPVDQNQSNSRQAN